MANCTGNNTLDPLQTILDQVGSSINTLEKQANDIIPSVDSFRSTGSIFPEELISPKATVNNAMNAFTDEAICASKTNIGPIDDLVEDCLNEAIKGVKSYLNNMLGNIEDGMNLISELLSLPEFDLMKSFQNICRLCDNIGDLVGGIDGKIQCVSLSSLASNYQSQIDDLMDRVNTVTDSLYLDSDGSFNSDKLMDGFQSDLKDNLNSYDKRSKELQSEIRDNVSSTINLNAKVNPKRFF